MADALLMLGMGGPDSPEDIKPFLINLLSDVEIINFGVGERFQRHIAKHIAKMRGPKTAVKYRKIGGGSPQYNLTKALCDKISSEYKSLTGGDLDTYVGMCYWRPFIADTVKQLAENSRHRRYRRIYVATIYPQFSSTTVGACLAHLRRAFSHTSTGAVSCILKQYHMNPGYLNCVALRIGEAAKKLGVPLEKAHILASAHSIPCYACDNGDPYPEQVAEQMATLAEMMKPASYSIAYQSKVGKQKWLTPCVDDELTRLAGKGIKDVIVLAPSFINDHIETLVDLDEELLGQAKQMGINAVRVESLNDSDDFALAMARFLAEV